MVMISGGDGIAAAGCGDGKDEELSREDGGEDVPVAGPLFSPYLVCSHVLACVVAVKALPHVEETEVCLQYCY